MLSRRRAFTLIELLIVVAILGILMSILLPALFMVSEQARQSQARAELRTLATALESYRDDWGVYPPDGGAASTTALFRYLDGDPANGGPRTPYYDFDLDRVNPAGEFLDPWGLPYSYDELESERLTSRGDPDGDPRTNQVAIDTYDLWAPHPDDDPSDWPTSYRSQ